MNRLTDRSKEIPLPCADNSVFWARVHEKLARYEDTGLEPEQCAKYAQAGHHRASGRRDGGMFRKLIHRIRKRRFCKANRWFCPDCIYHEHLFDGVVYRGVRCHYPTEGGDEDG